MINTEAEIRNKYQVIYKLTGIHLTPKQTKKNMNFAKQQGPKL